MFYVVSFVADGVVRLLLLVVVVMVVGVVVVFAVVVVVFTLFLMISDRLNLLTECATRLKRCLECQSTITGKAKKGNL